MKEFTRSDMMHEMLLAFSRDSLQEEIYLSLYSSEIKKFEKRFPELDFKKEDIVTNPVILGKQYRCKITKI